MKNATEEIQNSSATADEMTQLHSSKSGRVVSRVTQCSDRVCGMTILDNSMFVLRCRDDNQLEVYDVVHQSVSRSIQRCLSLPRLYRDDWNDLTSSGKDRCLYVSNFSMNRVQRVEPADGSVTMWPMPEAPCGLSMTPSDHLLVTFHEEQKPGKIMEFDLVGNCVRKVVLETSIEWTWHAIHVKSALQQGQYLISHGYYDQQDHCVSLVGAADGRKFHNYGGIPGSAVGQLYVPYHLALGPDGRVFVADHHNGRVIVLSAQLELEGCVASQEGGELNCQPRRLYFDDRSRALYVGQDDGTITVMQL